MEYTDIELKNEQWRDIDGYDGAYQVSDLGRVRSNKSGEWRVLKPSKNTKGYLQVALWKDGEKKGKGFRVHRLVAQAFIPNYDSSKTLINHINEVKTDNRVSNLEWCDYRYNNTYNDIHHRRIVKRYNYIRPKIKDLYDPKLSIKENIEIFMANGIECSRDTVVQLRKDLGLTNNKRKEIKDLYDPNLTWYENIELFKANGIECCRETVKRLRKDLGLTRKYTKRS